MAYRDEVLADSPLLYWELDDSTGSSVADSSGNSRAGTVNGTWTFQHAPHVTGSTYGMTSGGGYIVSPTISFGSADITVEMWVDIDTSQSYMPFSFGVSSLDMWVNAGKMGVNVGSGTQYGCTVPVGRHHVVAVMPNNKSTANTIIYIDGVQQSLSGLTGTAPSLSSTTFRVSGWTTDANYRIPNSYYVDEVAIYSGALSSTRVTAHYDAGKLPLAAQIEAQYLEVMATGLANAQVEANYLEVMATGLANAQVESNYLEVMYNNPTAQVETVYTEALIVGTPAAQVETVYTEALISSPRMQAEAVYAEVLAAGTPQLQAEAVYAEVLAGGTPQLQAEAVYAEVLVSLTIFPGFKGWGVPIRAS